MAEADEGSGVSRGGGRIRELVERHTEADPAALLVQFLIGFGNLCGSAHTALPAAWRIT